MRRMGSTCPVRLVMCGSSMTRVRGVIAAATCSSTWSSVDGTRKVTGFTTTPSRRARCSHAVSMRG